MQRALGVVLVLLATLVGCEAVPSGIKVDGSEVLRVNATGEQTYAWRAATSSWVLKGLQAKFTEVDEGRITGKHYADTSGLVWVAEDGSLVVGRTESERTSSDPNSIPWILFRAVDHRGYGILSQVTFIQRVNTKGGMPPKGPGKKDGEEVQINYTAVYVFYGPGSAGGK